MAQLDDRFQTLECQFHLPSQPIALQHLTGGGTAPGQGGEYQNVAGVFLFLRRNGPTAVLMLNGEPALPRWFSTLAFAVSADAACYLLIFQTNPTPPFRSFASFAQRPN